MINANGFEFNKKTSDEFGLIICTFDSGGKEDGKAGSHISFTTSSSPVRNRWLKFGNAIYDEQLEFSFQVAKSNFKTFDSYELASIQRWLVRKDGYKDFQLIKSDYDNIHFNACIPSIQYIEICGEVVGLTINVKCDSPFGYGSYVTKKIDTSENNVLTIVDMSDEIGFIYPDITINVNSDCDIKIHNSIEDRTLYIKKCVENEIITIDSTILQMSTTAVSHNLYENTNYMLPRICNKDNDRKNVFTISGDCVITMKYRPIRKVGV